MGLREGTEILQRLARVGRNRNIMAANPWRDTPLRFQNTKAGRDHAEEAAKSAASSFLV